MLTICEGKKKSHQIASKPPKLGLLMETVFVICFIQEFLDLNRQVRNPIFQINSKCPFQSKAGFLSKCSTSTFQGSKSPP